MEKLRAILDTNVYEQFVKDEKLFLEVKSTDKLVIYGNKVIRDELRDIPKNAKYQNKSVRNLLINIFDKLVNNRMLNITDLTVALALDYYKEYKGTRSVNKLFNDFLIVANASLNNLDVIVSEDNSTMAYSLSCSSYFIVNQKNNLRVPKFYSIKKLKELIQ